MAPAPNPNPSAVAAAANSASIGFWPLLAIVAPHIAALGLMLRTETDFGSRLSFLLSWAILNFFWIALLRRPALSGALSLSFVAVLVLLSRLKHDVVQMTANFVDLMVIDRDSAAFLFTIFPNLHWSVLVATKFAVIWTTSCLSRDNSTSTATKQSDSAPDNAGRRNSAPVE
jgi:hypothetical protein